MEIFTQSQKLPLQLLTDCKTVISIQFETQENQREAFKLPVPWVPMNMMIGQQILDRPDVDGITQRPSPRYTDLDGLMDSVASRTELKDAIKELSFALFLEFSLGFPWSQIQTQIRKLNCKPPEKVQTVNLRQC